jgi:Uma2 family endonuclease
VFIELSLEVSQIDLSQFGLKAKEELKPDICLYPKTEKSGFRKRDILKMSDMPLLAIEIISPKQGIDDILTKFDVCTWYQIVLVGYTSNGGYRYLFTTRSTQNFWYE